MLRERDGMEAETDRLAEAYAAGARVLGQQAAGAEPARSRLRRHRPPRGARDCRSSILPQLVADEPAPQEEQTRQELRASALRAKLKAQATQQEPTTGERRARPAGRREHRAG